MKGTGACDMDLSVTGALFFPCLTPTLLQKILAANTATIGHPTLPKKMQFGLTRTVYNVLPLSLITFL